MALKTESIESLYIGKLDILESLHPPLSSPAREQNGVILLHGLQSKICICYRGQNVATIIHIVVGFPCETTEASLIHHAMEGFPLIVP